MSTRCSGAASRSFIIGSRLWPPAITRASGPSRSSSARASSTLVARSYSNGAGTCIQNLLFPRGLPNADARRVRSAVKDGLTDRLIRLTFAQLRSFATVARLGSVRAAARDLGVSEPAVSAAIATLRRDFGDELLVRHGNLLTLTTGAQRLAAAASELLGLADEARRAVAGEAGIVRIAATSEVAEYIVPPLVDAFTRRFHETEVSVTVEPHDSFPALLAA